jgi:hypothetical protein
VLLWGQGHQDRACGDARSHRHFNALARDLGVALNAFKVPVQAQRELVAILAPLQGDTIQR